MAAVISITSRNADGFTISLNNSDGAGVAYTFELNRAADFASDDTIICVFSGVGSGVSSRTIAGLPAGNPFYIRARSNAVGALYSNIVFAAVLPAVQNLTFAGYSVDKALMVVPADVNNVTTGLPNAQTAVRSGFPVTNLQRDDPQATFQAFATSGVMAISINFETSGEPIDTIALLGTLIDDSATWRIQSSDVAGDFTAGGFTNSGTIAMRCSPTLGRRQYYHALYSFATPTQNRYWRINLAGNAPHFLARNLVAGVARASVNPSQGYGFDANDQGSASRTRFGGLDRVFGWRGRNIDFQMSWLSEAEFHTKWAIVPQLVGKSVSVLTIANSKRNIWLNDRIGFGPLSTMRGENMRGAKFQQSVVQDSIY